MVVQNKVLSLHHQTNINIKKIEIMTLDLNASTQDLQTLFAHTRGAYNNINFQEWSKETEKSYLSYFNNKELFSYRKYSYSQWVNSQVISLQQPY